MVKQAWLGDFKESREAWNFIVIHLTYQSKKIK